MSKLERHEYILLCRRLRFLRLYLYPPLLPVSEFSKDVRKTQYLGRDVVGSTTERPRGLVAGHAFLTHTEVGQLNVTVTIEQDVVQLEVSAPVTADAPHYSAGPDLGGGAWGLGPQAPHQQGTSHQFNSG